MIIILLYAEEGGTIITTVSMVRGTIDTRYVSSVGHAYKGRRGAYDWRIGVLNLPKWAAVPGRAAYRDLRATNQSICSMKPPSRLTME